MTTLFLGKKDTPVIGGRYVVARMRSSNRAICFARHVDGTVLRAIFEEVKKLALSRPIVVYGHTCTVGETETFRFEQVAGDVTGFKLKDA